MDRKKVQLLRTKIAEVLEPLGKELGLKMSVVGNASFSNSNVTFKVEVAEVNEDGEAQTRAVEEFKAYAVLYGLQEDMFGKTFTIGSNIYKICGLKAKAHKYPVLAKRSDGKVFKFSVSSILNAMYL